MHMHILVHFTLHYDAVAATLWYSYTRQTRPLWLHGLCDFANMSRCNISPMRAHEREIISLSFSHIRKHIPCTLCGGQPKKRRFVQSLCDCAHRKFPVTDRWIWRWLSEATRTQKNTFFAANKLWSFNTEKNTHCIHAHNAISNMLQTHNRPESSTNLWWLFYYVLWSSKCLCAFFCVCATIWFSKRMEIFHNNQLSSVLYKLKPLWVQTIALSHLIMLPFIADVVIQRASGD